MKLRSRSFEDRGRIPERFAMGKADPGSHATGSENVSPHLEWSDLPAGTRSLVLIAHDADAPHKKDDANREGKQIPYDYPRAEFVHWVLVDLKPEPNRIEEGEFARGITAHGKKGPASARGTRAGLNDYTGWFEGDAGMQGRYFGYDGPWPPWNDARLHRYHFTLYALDVEECPVAGTFTAADVRRAIEGRVLGKASLVGTYAINPKARE